jgi:hypothetical protein
MIGARKADMAGPKKQLARGCLSAVIWAGLLASAPAFADGRVLEVGEGKTFATPSLALREARDGDRILLAPGEYFDCAFVKANNLVIEGTGPDATAVITDKACGGKALLVVDGSNLTLKNLTLTRARVPDGNGAGIRAEARDLVAEGVKFVNNQVAILAGDIPDSTIRLTSCTFVNNGTTDSNRPGHAAWIGQVARLQIEHSHFKGTKGGSDIASGALFTALSDNDLDADQNSATDYLIEATNGGSLVVEDNSFTLSPRSKRLAATILAAADGATPANKLLFRRNAVRNESGAPVTFVLNWSGVAPVLDNNVLDKVDDAVSTDGSLHHWAGTAFWALKEQMRHFAGTLKHRLLGH